ncbi:hypothetical protein C8R44DRAFT_740220 [Mycena epipterygia]|nr:hypothetical protein C8R44DRAFT_740220 [Mycena epipterygia]
MWAIFHAQRSALGQRSLRSLMVAIDRNMIHKQKVIKGHKATTNIPGFVTGCQERINSYMCWDVIAKYETAFSLVIPRLAIVTVVPASTQYLPRSSVPPDLTHASLESFGFPLGFDLWVRVICFLLYSLARSPAEAAKFRSLAACVSKSWQRQIYGLPVFWSTITICKALKMDRLDFVLAHCGDADLRIELSLRDVAMDSTRSTSLDIVELVDTIFSHISHTSARWISFALTTENPLAFLRVQHHCKSIVAPALSSFGISYVHLPGYSVYPDDDPIYDAPFHCGPWFSHGLPRLTDMRVFCIPMAWAPPALFSKLECLDIFTQPSIDLAFLHQLFTCAIRLHTLRLGAITGAGDFSFISVSLAVLDMDFDYGDRCGYFIANLVAPRLQDLTVRAMLGSVHLLLDCPDILGQLVRLCVHHGMGDDDQAMFRLFASMPRMQELDLTASSVRAFEQYCHWACSRSRSGPPPHAYGLRRLLLCQVDLNSLANLIAFLQDRPAECHAGVRFVRVEKPFQLALFSAAATFLRLYVPNFAFTTYYSYPPSGVAASLVNAPSFHAFVDPTNI